MGSQFVDLNADGHLDYVTATFDGSPHVAYGTAKGFSEPVRLKDRDGRRIMMSSIWNYESKAHEDYGEAMPGGEKTGERCISALAFDWDGDGDFDLLLGGYEYGRLYRQMNEGSNEKPAFTGKNIAVMAGDKPFAVMGKMTAPRLVDWDGDGDLDLVVGSFGDSWNMGHPGGGVWVALNEATEGEARFGALQVLLPMATSGGTAPTAPHAGLYVDPVDWDGDGDLDLVVGGYSLWQPPERSLTVEEQKALAVLDAKLEKTHAAQEAIQDEQQRALDAGLKGLTSGSEAWQAKMSEIVAGFREQRTKVRTEREALLEERDRFIPSQQREGFVWIYERL